MKDQWTFQISLGSKEFVFYLTDLEECFEYLKTLKMASLQFLQLSSNRATLKCHDVTVWNENQDSEIAQRTRRFLADMP